MYIKTIGHLAKISSNVVANTIVIQFNIYQMKTNILPVGKSTIEISKYKYH